MQGDAQNCIQTYLGKESLTFDGPSAPASAPLTPAAVVAAAEAIGIVGRPVLVLISCTSASKGSSGSCSQEQASQ